MKHSILSVLAVSALLCSAVGAASFTKNKTYTPGQFADVPEAEWYAASVKDSYELGFMQGSSDTTFEPEGSMTVAEAITVASRVAAIYKGETIDTSVEGEWYAPYVAYGVKSGFIAQDQFTAADFDREAKRYEVASVFAKALPKEYFTAVNDVASIPDIDARQPYAADLLMLYKAGIVMGSDSFGDFFPENNITRAEAAAIINRVALPESRLKKSLDVHADDDAYLLVTSRYGNLTDDKTGIRSGWTYDMRGSAPQESYNASYGHLVDISETEGAAYIREFAPVRTGRIVLQTVLTLGEKANGAFIEYRNDKDESVYRLEVKDGAWSVRNADGSYAKLLDIADVRAYAVNVVIDLDNARSTTSLNGVVLGTHPLQNGGPLVNFRVATTEKEQPSITMGQIKMTVNYAVYELFSFANKGSLANDEKYIPFDWTNLGESYVSGSALCIPGGSSVLKSFDAVSGTVAAEFNAILPKGEKLAYTLRSGEKEVVKFESDGKNFLVNGSTVYEDFYPNLWYRFRFELDTFTETFRVKVNGIYVTDAIPFGADATSVDNFLVTNSSDTEIKTDSFKVFRLIEHEDYVPEPVVPKDDDNYLVGMNVCSLWVNELHAGWDVITPYKDIEPVLGYYDEGNPELADWEIKYIVEHGIDFQAFCVYFDSADAPLNNDGEREHLFNGFQNAKYSDMTKYCIIWEAGNAKSPNSFESWKNYYVPYFIEQYFKDPRYMTVGNKPIVLVFSPANQIKASGGAEVTKKMFDYIDEEVKKLGFDGVLFVANNATPSAELASAGYAATSAYNWSTAGSSLTTNTSKNEENAKTAQKCGMYTIPTISVGFNNIAWGNTGTRFPMMNMGDYAAAQKWVKDTYLPTYAKEEWQKKLVMLSTWNEYGEGTYIMPTADERGFGYLDALREAYTNEEVSIDLDTVPTEAQKARICRSFPQDRGILRREGRESGASNLLETVYTLDYTKPDGLKPGNITTIDYTSEGAVGVSGGDALISRSVSDFKMNLKEIPYIRVTCKADSGEGVQIFFATASETNINEAKSFKFNTTSSEMNEYLIETSGNRSWAGTLTSIRVDPVQGADKTFAFLSIEFLREPTAASKNIVINGRESGMIFAPQAAENGDLLVAFDTAVSLDYKLGAVYDWDKATKTLTLSFKKNHTAVFTVGNDFYTFDGKKQSLGYKLTSLDGLPLLPIEKLCRDLGYSYSLDEKQRICIDTDDKWYYDRVTDRKFGEWTFDLLGDTEGWTSSFMALSVSGDGYMNCVSTSESTDPTILFKNITLPAEKYVRLEYRVRHEWIKSIKDDPNQLLTMYFITDRDGKWNEAKTLKVKLCGQSSDGEFVEYAVDTSSNELWKDTITSLRFDPFNAYGTIDIDYIRFVENPDYVDPGERPMEIINGDAEHGSPAFTDTHGKMQIVEDPDNPSNKCYFLPCDDIEIWLYARQKVTFKPGYSYKLSMDVRTATHGTNTELEDTFKMQLLANMVYDDPDTGKSDHVVGSVPVAVKDGWKHVTFEFTINENSVNRSQDTLSFYTNPVDHIGAGYYFDNVTIEEIAP